MTIFLIGCIVVTLSKNGETGEKGGTDSVVSLFFSQVGKDSGIILSTFGWVAENHQNSTQPVIKHMEITSSILRSFFLAEGHTQWENLSPSGWTVSAVVGRIRDVLFLIGCMFLIIGCFSSCPLSSFPFSWHTDHPTPYQAVG